MFHRIASSDKYSSGLREIMWDWTLDDVLDAHLVLNAYREAEIRAHRKARPKK